MYSENILRIHALTTHYLYFIEDVSYNLTMNNTNNTSESKIVEAPMSPSRYFPEIYLQDKERLQCVNICGYQLHAFNEHSEEWPYLEHFLISAYELELLNQTIHSHFHADHEKWEKVTPPSIDLGRGAGCHNVDHPIDAVITGIKLNKRIKNRITRTLMRDYDELFLEFARKTINENDFKVLSMDKLIQAITNDPDNHQARINRFLEELS